MHLALCIDMAFDTTQITTLKKFVSELRESLNIKIYVYNAIDDSLLGTAIVGIWIMIEDGCNIVRQVCHNIHKCYSVLCHLNSFY